MLNRRLFVFSIGVSALLPAVSPAADAKDILPLWPAGVPGGGGPSGPVDTSAKGAVCNIAVPTLEVFRPTQPNGSAMLVAGGGGYKRIEMESEAYPAARWLNDRGVTAFVLSYRLPGEGWSKGPLAPLQDAQRAMRLIRANVDRYGLKRDRIGVLGFSAGGHLMGLAATRSAFAAYQPVDAADDQSGRPDVAALIYPVITLDPPYDHTSTAHVLIGRHASAAKAEEWSVESHVHSHCPPMFLVQAEDDPISDPHNTLIMEAACQKANIPVELHRLASGGHGFGMGRPGSPTAAWPGWYEAWLKTDGLV